LNIHREITAGEVIDGFAEKRGRFCFVLRAISSGINRISPKSALSNFILNSFWQKMMKISVKIIQLGYWFFFFFFKRPRERFSHHAAARTEILYDCIITDRVFPHFAWTDDLPSSSTSLNVEAVVNRIVQRLLCGIGMLDRRFASKFLITAEPMSQSVKVCKPNTTVEF